MTGDSPKNMVEEDELERIIQIACYFLLMFILVFALRSRNYPVRGLLFVEVRGVLLSSNFEQLDQRTKFSNTVILLLSVVIVFKKIDSLFT